MMRIAYLSDPSVAESKILQDSRTKILTLEEFKQMFHRGECVDGDTIEFLPEKAYQEYLLKKNSKQLELSLTA